MNLKECVEQRFLVEEAPSQDLIDKELKETDYDFQKAQKAVEEQDYKWAIVKCYYSMFHSAKAVCFKLGYREKKHFAVLMVLEYLNKEGKLESKYVHYFEAAIDSREGADYKYTYSKEIAEYNLKIARTFNEQMKQLAQRL